MTAQCFESSPAWNRSNTAGMSLRWVRSPDAPKMTMAHGGAGRWAVVATISPSGVVTETSSAMSVHSDRCRAHATLFTVNAYGVATELVDGKESGVRSAPV